MVAGNSEYIRNILKVKSNMDSGMFLPMQMAAVEALSNPESWYDTVNETYKERRKIAVSIMEILKCKFSNDQVGLFIWGRLPDEVESCEAFIEEILVKANVFMTPGFIFGSNGERYIRISLCASNERLKEARERIEIRISKIHIHQSLKY